MEIHCAGVENLSVKIVIHRKNPPTDVTIGGFAAARPPLVEHRGFDSAFAPNPMGFEFLYIQANIKVRPP